MTAISDTAIVAQAESNVYDYWTDDDETQWESSHVRLNTDDGYTKAIKLAESITNRYQYDMEDAISSAVVFILTDHKSFPGMGARIDKWLGMVATECQREYKRRLRLDSEESIDVCEVRPSYAQSVERQAEVNVAWAMVPIRAKVIAARTYEGESLNGPDHDYIERFRKSVRGAIVRSVVNVRTVGVDGRANSILKSVARILRVNGNKRTDPFTVAVQVAAKIDWTATYSPTSMDKTIRRILREMKAERKSNVVTVERSTVKARTATDMGMESIGKYHTAIA